MTNQELEFEQNKIYRAQENRMAAINYAVSIHPNGVTAEILVEEAKLLVQFIEDIQNNNNK